MSETTDCQANRLTGRERLFSFLLMLLPLMIIARITIFSRRRAAGEFDTVDGAAIIQVLIVVFIIIVISIAPKVQIALRHISRSSLSALIIYYFICIVSAIWSVSPEYSIYRSVEFITQALAIFISLYYLTNVKNLEKRVLFIAAIVILLGIGLNLKYGNFSLSAIHTNTYSAVAAMMFVYCVAEYLVAANGKRRVMLRNWGLFGLFFLAIGTSGASNVSALGGLALIALLSKNKMLLVVVVLLGLLGVFVLSQEDIISWRLPGKSMHSIETGSGRSMFWDIMFHHISESPWLGSGFAASTRALKTLFYLTNTHNGYLAVLLGTGLFGAVFFLRFLWRVVSESLFMMRMPGRVGLGASIAVAVGLANNMAVSIVGEQWGVTSFGLILFLVFQIRLIRLYQEQTKREKEEGYSHVA